MTYDRFKWKTNGKADDKNTVIVGFARFTVLTDRLFRMEFDKSKSFVDLASQTVFHRNFPESAFSFNEENGIFTLETKALILTYTVGKEFSADTLSVKLKEYPATVWNYGSAVPQLKGTACTLDNVNGSIALEDGVVSRNGYTVVDDSESLLLSENGWFETRKPDTKDIYFFGYGHDYRGCISDFYRLTGAPPLLPDYAFGNWWSRYHKYSQQEYCDLMERFIAEKIPFSVSVVDMDWHTIEIPKESCIDHPRFWKGWTGYSWNKELFPDYKAFLKSLESYGLKVALNLHPSNGIGCHEDMYREMAEKCGIDPDSKKLIKLDLLNPDFMENYFDVLHHPYEEDGVNFWWMDWQQGTDYWWVHDEDHPASELEGMEPLWILNHLHILDITRNGKRPMFFSRYCGLGAHRYPVGFSGDTITTWQSLDFQPYFTANASNAGYCWWSHDIGGHMQGYRDDELQIRWLQLGVLSPINRLHSTNDPFAGKEPWNLSAWARPIAEDWLRKRHQLFPYLYTMNYKSHTELSPLVQPMYYLHPECDEAYEFKNQYWFGTEFFVAPITEKNGKSSLMGSTEVWLPEGKWIDAFGGLVYEGDRTLRVHRSLEEYPVFAKAGAIVPTEIFKDNKLGLKDELKVFVFAGESNTFNLYEDAGDGSEYKNGDFAVTEMSLNWGKTASFKIAPANGNTALLPKKRKWHILLRGFAAGLNLTVCVDGKPYFPACEYEKSTNTTEIIIEDVSVNSEVEINISAENSLLTDNSYAKQRVYDIILHSQMNYAAKTALWDSFCAGNKFLYLVCPEEQNKDVLSAVEEMRSLL